MAKKLKSKKWFVPVRGSYLPNSWQGWLTYIPFTAYLLFTLIYGFDITATHAAAPLIILPNWIAAAAVMTWLAKRTS